MAGEVLIRLDNYKGERSLHLDVERRWDEDITQIQIDDGDPFRISTFKVNEWSVAEIDPAEVDRFFAEFIAGRNLLVFLSSKRIITFSPSSIIDGPSRLIEGLLRCHEGQHRGVQRGGRF